MRSWREIFHPGPTLRVAYQLLAKSTAPEQAVCLVNEILHSLQGQGTESPYHAVATNVLIRNGRGQWRFLVHHASQRSRKPAPGSAQVH